ncbi:MAG: ribonuclease Z [Oscillospiraceae bacterium]|nr:ribonuclease Z [Oscillospiraceae bacterium]
MLEVTLPGTGGTMPLKNRWLTCCLIRCEGHGILIDCGEGTQIALRCAGRSVQRLDLLCITHFHADHISGLPGLLLSMGQDGRTEPLTIAGPRGLVQTVAGLRTIAPELPFPIVLTELTEQEELLHFAGLEITAFAVRHTLPCYGYRLHLPRPGKFDPERARSGGVPMAVWGLLQKQPQAEYQGVIYEQDQVLGPPRRGLTVTYCTDTRPTPAILKAADSADLLILEGMYGDDEKLGKALETKHMLFSEAAEIAAEANAKRLWLTHYSPSLPDPETYLPAARAIFPETVCARDGESLTLRYCNEEGEA